MYRGCREMDICNSISELAYLSGIELTATLDTKVGLLKAMDILDENFDCHTADAGQQEKNFRLVEKIIEEKKNAYLKSGRRSLHTVIGTNIEFISILDYPIH